MQRLEETQVSELVEGDLRPFIGKLVLLHVKDGPKQILNYDDEYVGRVQGYHVSNPNARRTSAGDGSISLDTYRVQITRYQHITITELKG